MLCLLAQANHLSIKSASHLLRTSKSCFYPRFILTTSGRHHIYQSLGFTVVDPEPISPTIHSAKATIAPPSLKSNGDRRRLLRAWVELGAWLQDYRKRFREYFTCI